MQLDDSYRFRVWDVNRKIFYIDPNIDEDYHIGSPGGDFFISSNGSLVTNESQCACCCASCIKEIKEEMIVQKCTGFKDKNGAFIYEGDIIRRKEEKCPASFLEVRFDIEYKEFLFFDKSFKGTLILSNIRIYLENHEIIGNIFENEELLNAEKEG